MAVQNKILIVNDVQDQLDLTTYLLREAGYESLAASDGAKALEIASRELPDLIVSDVVMPAMDGIDLCREIRRNTALSRTPILLVSGLRHDDESVVAGLAAGADEYLELPFNPPTFIARVTRMVERKRSHDLLAANDKRFRGLIENSTDIISTLTLDGVVGYESPSIEAVLGYKPEELIGRNVFKYIHADDVERVQQRFNDAVQRGAPTAPITYRARHKDGSWRVLESVGKAFVESGRPRFVIVNSRDITEIRRESDERRKSDQRLKMIFDSVGAGLGLFNMAGHAIECNAALERMLGYTAEELGRLSFVDYTHPDDVDRCGDLLDRLKAGDIRSFETEKRYIRKDGGTFWARLCVSMPFCVNGSEDTFIAVVEDNTERSLAAAALVEANERAINEYIRLLEKLGSLGERLAGAHDLGSIYDAVCDFIVASVPCSAIYISRYDQKSDSRTGLYLWYNDRGMSAAEMGPTPVGDGPVGQAIRSGKTLIFNDFLGAIAARPSGIRYGYDDDSRDPRSALVAPLMIMGRVIGAVEVQSYDAKAYSEEHATAMQMAASLTASAIENAELLEQTIAKAEQLRQAQKLESVGRLAGGIAHDFNNMLTAINGYSELTLRRLEPGDPLRRNVEEIKKAGERSAALTHQLLAFSRQQVLQPRIMELNQAVEDVRVLLERLIGENIQLELNLAPDAGLIEADPSQLTQVIMNLAVNSRDAMPEGGQILIQTQNVYLDEDYAARHIGSRPGSFVMLAVTDNGVGMSEQIQKHIFEPFYTTKEIGKGTGLGLPTVYGIVKQSGGYIWCYSEEGFGTSFKIYLPRADKDACEIEEERRSESVTTGNETILLVEDQELVRDLTTQLLKSCGYRVIQACDGEEALDICEKASQNIDLLITDIVMPKISGRQLVALIGPKLPGMKILYMSGYTDDAIVQKGIIEPDSNFIAKPFTLTDLAHKVRQCLDAAPRSKTYA
jgi:PAS domain S-box-containing protein